jgi:hypothetical protein
MGRVETYRAYRAANIDLSGLEKMKPVVNISVTSQDWEVLNELVFKSAVSPLNWCQSSV